MSQELKLKIQEKIKSARKYDARHNIKCQMIFTHEVLHLLKMQNNQCFYCDFKMVLNDYVNHPDGFTCDRLDNSVGHCRENIVMSCRKCNGMKKNKKYNFKLIPQHNKQVHKEIVNRSNNTLDMSFTKFNLSEEEINKRIRIGLAISDILHCDPIDTIKYVCEDRDNQVLGWLWV